MRKTACSLTQLAVGLLCSVALLVVVVVLVSGRGWGGQRGTSPVRGIRGAGEPGPAPCCTAWSSAECSTYRGSRGRAGASLDSILEGKLLRWSEFQNQTAYLASVDLHEE